MQDRTKQRILIAALLLFGPPAFVAAGYGAAVIVAVAFDLMLR